MSDNSTVNQNNFPLVPTIQYTTPSTGDTIAANSGAYNTVIINPAGTLLALTLTLPSSPADKDVIRLASSQIVTGFTMSGGTMVGALTTLAVATFASYMYSATASKWFRVG